MRGSSRQLDRVAQSLHLSEGRVRQVDDHVQCRQLRLAERFHDRPDFAAGNGLRA